jgi:hypothetical protein
MLSLQKILLFTIRSCVVMDTISFLRFDYFQGAVSLNFIHTLSSQVNSLTYKATDILTNEVSTFNSQVELAVGIDCSVRAITALLHSENPRRAIKGKYVIEEI